MPKRKKEYLDRVCSPMLHRRQFLGGSFALGTALSLNGIGKAYAAQSTAHRTVFCYLSGGWDMLASIHAREPNAKGFMFNKGGTNTEKNFSIDTMSIGGTELLVGNTLNPLKKYLKNASLFNVSMNTNSHPVGRAYINTGRKPSGSGNAEGDSMGLALIDLGNQKALNDRFLLPSVAIALPSYNQTGRFTQNTAISRAYQAKTIASAVTTPLPAAVGKTISSLEDHLLSCVGVSYPQASPTDRVTIARDRARILAKAGYDKALNVLADPALVTRFNLKNDNKEYAPGYRAAVAAQLLRNYCTTSSDCDEYFLSRDVSVTIQGGLDTHTVANDPAQIHKQAQAFKAIAALIDHLEEHGPGLANTTVIISSEFSRTPNIVSGGGRDHWLSNAMIVIDPKLKPGIYGSIGQESYLPEVYTPIGEIIRPEHVIATLFDAHGLKVPELKEKPIPSVKI